MPDAIPETTVNPAATITDYAGNADTTAENVPIRIDTIAPYLESVVWNDNDSAGYYTVGDTFVLTFSEDMDPVTVTLDNLALTDNGQWGSLTVIAETVASTEYTITLGADHTVLGGMTVDPTVAVTDAAANPDATPIPLDLGDTIAPLLTGTVWTHNDAAATPVSTGYSAGDYLTLTFSEPMTETVVTGIVVGGQTVAVTSSVWSKTVVNSDTVRLTLGTNAEALTAGMTLTVSALSDLAGNPAENTSPARELPDGSAPRVVDASDLYPVLHAGHDLVWTDTDSNARISAGDTFTIYFSETLDWTSMTLKSFSLTASGHSWGDAATVTFVDATSATPAHATIRDARPQPTP